MESIHCQTEKRGKRARETRRKHEKRKLRAERAAISRKHILFTAEGSSSGLTLVNTRRSALYHEIIFWPWWRNCESAPGVTVATETQETCQVKACWLSPIQGLTKVQAYLASQTKWDVAASAGHCHWLGKFPVKPRSPISNPSRWPWI